MVELLRDGNPRVVITGMGAVSALGDVNELWESLKAGKSGVRRLENTDTDPIAVKIGAEVTDFDPDPYIDRKEARRMGRASQFAIASAKMAVEDAGLTPEDIAEQGERVGTVVGTTLGCFEISQESIHKFLTEGYKRANPMSLINSLPNMPGHYVSRIMGALGPLIVPSVACATGVQAIGEGVDLIRYGRCDMAITGAVEAVMKNYLLAGFDAMKAMTTEYNDDPERASRPFDADRSGFVLGEGCGIFVLEKLEHALERGATIHAEILGYATSSDAYHVAAPDPDGAGAIRCMKWALQDAKLNPDEIGYINAHGTSTKANDAIETHAIKQVFGEKAYEIPVSSTKSMLGHAMAACAPLEIIACIQSLKDRIIHPTINYETPDPECDLDYVPNAARDVPNIKYSLNNNFGLGGQNGSMVFGRV